MSTTVVPVGKNTMKKMSIGSFNLRKPSPKIARTGKQGSSKRPMAEGKPKSFGFGK